ncbi:MAG: N-acetyl sugar amidotransferase [Peptostreptococcaceae bacterium]|nr:N-acetyl sugar amidotransferase [Peptostreptococcaceae bacterium]
MRYCKKCVMPDTRPGIFFDEEGICQACRAEEAKDTINWENRFEELRQICGKYRGMNGDEPDCMIAVSGGKDSHFQVHVMKELMDMNPILVSVEDNFTMTEAGKHNIRNISERFGCNIISLRPNRNLQRKLMRKTFEKYGKPTWYIDRLIYTYPMHMALKFGTPLLVYGENVSYEYGGTDREETYSARDQLNNGVASDIPWEELLDEQIGMKDLFFCQAPSKEQIESDLDPIYISYYLRWSSYSNYIFAKRNGFHDLSGEWDRLHHAENFDQVDSKGYLVHPWMKYPKFGHAAATDYASKFIRYGLTSREEAIELVREKDHNIDPQAVEDFCSFAGYTETEFWKIVDRFYNRDIFEKDIFGQWKLKEAIR